VTLDLNRAFLRTFSHLFHHEQLHMRK